MLIARKPEDEDERLAFLHALEILDTGPEEKFDSVTRLACKLLSANFSVVSLIDRDRQWFKSKCGLDVSSTTRDVSFCAHTILEDQTFVVEDSLRDERFSDNPLVTGSPGLRAYLGHPLTVGGMRLGALCVLYTRPRSFGCDDRADIRDLARIVEELIAFSHFRDTIERGYGKALRASDVVLRKAIQLNSEPTILLKSSNGVVTDLNKACAEEIGEAREKLLGRPPPMTLLLDHARRSEMQTMIGQRGQVKDIEVPVQLGSEEPTRFLCSAEIVDCLGEPHLLVTGRNISYLTNRESLIRKALQATGGKTGRDYFEACARVVTSELHVRYAVVLGAAAGTSAALDVLGFWDAEGSSAMNALSFSDCPLIQTSNGGTAVHITHSVREQFPDSEPLRQLKAESCYCQPFFSSRGEPCGHVLVIDTKPFFDDLGRAALLTGVLAVRSAGELERQEMNRALEQAREKAEAGSRAKSRFLSNMSHELRTPLNAVLGFSQLMVRDQNLRSCHGDTLEIINQSGQHLLERIDALLEMSQIDVGQSSLQATATSIAMLTSRIESMFSPAAREKDLLLNVNTSYDVPDCVDLDFAKTLRILANLVGNAIRFTDAGKVELRVRVSNTAGDGVSRLTFEVEDTGIGIPENLIDDVFRPFEQIGRDKGLEGTGLGLSICKGHAEAMGGSIGVTSIPGVGSVFQFTLPLILAKQGTDHRESDRRPIQSVLPGASPADGNRDAQRILIVDDIDQGRLLLSRLLKPLGVEIREARNGQEAIDLEDQWRPHIILMDLRMPVMEGDEASAIIKSRRGSSSPVIIAITASVLRKNIAGVEELFDEFITKPFQIDELLAKIEPYLPNRHSKAG